MRAIAFAFAAVALGLAARVGQAARAADACLDPSASDAQHSPWVSAVSGDRIAFCITPGGCFEVDAAAGTFKGLPEPDAWDGERDPLAAKYTQTQGAYQLDHTDGAHLQIAKAEPGAPEDFKPLGSISFGEDVPLHGAFAGERVIVQYERESRGRARRGTEIYDLAAHRVAKVPVSAPDWTQVRGDLWAFVGENGHLVLQDVQSGKVKANWNLHLGRWTPARIYHAPAGLVLIYAGDALGQVLVVDPETGAVVRRVALPKCAR